MPADAAQAASTRGPSGGTDRRGPWHVAVGGFRGAATRRAPIRDEGRGLAAAPGRGPGACVLAGDGAIDRLSRPAFGADRAHGRGGGSPASSRRLRGRRGSRRDGHARRARPLQRLSAPPRRTSTSGASTSERPRRVGAATAASRASTTCATGRAPSQERRLGAPSARRRPRPDPAGARCLRSVSARDRAPGRAGAPRSRRFGGLAGSRSEDSCSSKCFRTCCCWMSRNRDRIRPRPA